MVPDSELRLMCVLAHPDDESLGTGGTLAKYAAEGVSTYLVTATRGEQGRFYDAVVSPGTDVVGQARESELLAAARELGVKDVRFLDYPDGGLDRVDPAQWAEIERLCREIGRPDAVQRVVSTFAPAIASARRSAAEEALIEHNSRRKSNGTPPPEGRGGGQPPPQLPKVSPQQAKSRLLSELLGFRR